MVLNKLAPLLANTSERLKALQEVWPVVSLEWLIAKDSVVQQLRRPAERRFVFLRGLRRIWDTHAVGNPSVGERAIHMLGILQQPLAGDDEVGTRIERDVERAERVASSGFVSFCRPTRRITSRKHSSINLAVRPPPCSMEVLSTESVSVLYLPVPHIHGGLVDRVERSHARDYAWRPDEVPLAKRQIIDPAYRVGAKLGFGRFDCEIVRSEGGAVDCPRVEWNRPASPALRGEPIRLREYRERREARVVPRDE
eukprot:CAMPEP_0182847422 /NCGR_PEP_ID=MMETSP0006_2-20121128/28451_1 /TAXON_ID=97485 /ORGANISM="Prymnesium parvum, Strain Texoma1" /LENGTH=253 /DNA_ID=CAMNT_0024977757 /DNA_START=249 /DNA_END=1012 /DNA_ORIENTATION=+